MKTVELSAKIENIKVMLDRVYAQLDDETLSDLDYDLISAQARKLDLELSETRSAYAIAKNAEIVAAKIANI